MGFEFDTGSRSHGTLRLEDLLRTVVDAMDEVIDSGQIEPPRDYQSFKALRDEACGYWSSSHHGTMGMDDGDLAQECYSECLDLLNEYCPPFCYFGMHEGDGSDLGVWVDTDAVEEAVDCGLAVKVSDLADLDQVEYDGIVEHAIVVNDHGNMTCYRPKITWDCAWGIV